jgi:CRISPR-associated protein (TIGR03986 family)
MSLIVPYTSVPLSPWVFQPSWADRISHDIPFRDGASGTVRIAIKAHTPVLCGGERKKEPTCYQMTNGQVRSFKCENTVHPFKLPGENGAYAIPGYSQRGMLRTVLETATFGRLQFFDDKKFSLRDLTPGAQHIYGKRLLDSYGSAPTKVVIKVQAGWMSFDRASKRWRVRPCKFARVDLNDVASLSGTSISEWAHRENIAARYNRWERSSTPSRSLHVKLWVHHPEWHEHGRRNADRNIKPLHQWVDICYAKASKDNPGSGATQHDGRIVFTGKPQAGTAPTQKKQEFFFHQPDGRNLEVSPEVFRTFQEIHDPKGSDINPSWDYWQKKLKSNPSTEIPVFFIEGSNNSVEAFGLAMMFKLPHSKSVADILENTNFAGKPSDHSRPEIVDLAEAMFGRKALRKGNEREEGGLKGRVSFEPAIAQGAPQPVEPALGPTVLSTPQGKFYPASIKQPLDPANPNWLAPDRDNKRRYASFTPVDSDPDGAPITLDEVKRPQLAGRKLYPAQGQIKVPPPPDNIHNPGKLCVVLKPLPETTVFDGRVHFHNLRAFELGALLWALTWGNDPALRHKIGMGRPLGLGEISIEITRLEIEWNDGREEERRQETLVADLIEYFKSEMDTRYREARASHPEPRKVWAANWENSEQIKTLLAAANPEIGKQKDLRYMPKPKEFAEVKRYGFVLAPYPEYPDRDAQVAPPEQLTPTQNRSANRTPPPCGPAGRATIQVRVGDNVRTRDDGEFGEVIEIDGEKAVVRFDYGVEEEVQISELERIGG